MSIIIERIISNNVEEEDTYYGEGLNLYAYCSNLKFGEVPWYP